MPRASRSYADTDDLEETTDDQSNDVFSLSDLNND